MRVIAQVAQAYLLMLLVGALWRHLPFEVVAPSLPVIIAAYLGVTTRDRVPHAVAGAVAIGYLADLLAGSPRGLTALVCGVVCLLARLSATRLLVRGRTVVMVFGFLASILASLLALVVRLGLGAPLAPGLGEVVVALGSALLTALFAPILFRLCRRVDVAFARTAREREATREGWLT